MFRKHVTTRLSAYCHHELPADQAARVAAHLVECGRCREELEQVRRGIRAAAALPLVSAPDSLWNDIVAQARPATSLRPGRLRLAAAGALAFALLVAGFFLVRPGGPATAWEVVRLEGSPRVASAGMADTARLAVGQWIETDAASRARINVGTIGEVDLEPNTRVRLVDARVSDHRLALDRGTMHARIWAPPRLFFVETPSAVAVDIGCAYTLEVTTGGDGLLRVTSGWVALERDGRESMVPADAACRTRRGIGPGTPYFEDAPLPLLSALVKLDFERGAAGDPLAVVVASARPRDSLTLWHLLARLDGEQRRRVYDKLAELVPPPSGVGPETIDERALESWRDKLESTWW